MLTREFIDIFIRLCVFMSWRLCDINHLFVVLSKYLINIIFLIVL